MRDWLAVGFLANQNMLRPDDEITGIDVDDELEAAIVRTARKTDYEHRLERRSARRVAPSARCSPM